MSERYDVAIVGGGIVGLATAYRLLERRPGLRLTVVEKERDLALHQSGRNSGVIHAGLYYAPGSRKARLCREGKDALERFCQEHGIPFERCGKLVVAVDDTELSRLADLRQRGEANGIRGLEEVGPERIREIEPHAAGVRALHLAETGIVDFRRVALAYGDEVRARGGRILLGHRVTDIERMQTEIVVETSRGPILAHHV
ncbi:MAG TPA: FAD-dependent oxidoreductase, partial [Actinomycetota bacterium]|nr:FAD-dependent oxidoreductase [Actinomycetota bacterium]